MEIESTQSEIVECTDIFYRKGHVLAEGIKAGSKSDVPSEMNILEWLPIPDELRFLQQLYLYLIYKTCCFIAMQNCPGCDEQIVSMGDPKHKVPNIGCQNKACAGSPCYG